MLLIDMFEIHHIQKNDHILPCFSRLAQRLIFHLKIQLISSVCHIIRKCKPFQKIRHGVIAFKKCGGKTAKNCKQRKLISQRPDYISL